MFIDEIDAVGRHRGTGLGGGHDEREQTLNQLLVEMDGFSINEGIIILAATNRPDILDPALLRPGRFDRQIVVNYPDVKGREEILKVHARGKPLAAEIQLDRVARLIPSLPARTSKTFNESAILAARRNKKEITMDGVNEAIKRVQMGPERSASTRRPTAAWSRTRRATRWSPRSFPDATRQRGIIPRGMAALYADAARQGRFISRQAPRRIAMDWAGTRGGACDGRHTTGSSRTSRWSASLRGAWSPSGANDEIGRCIWLEKRSSYAGISGTQPSRAALADRRAGAHDHRERRGSRYSAKTAPSSIGRQEALEGETGREELRGSSTSRRPRA